MEGEPGHVTGRPWMPDSPREAGGDSLGHPGSDLSSDLAVGPAAVA